jgi:hypothetical protein
VRLNNQRQGKHAQQQVLMVVHCEVVDLQICVLGYSSRVLTLLRGQVNRGSGGENRNWELKGPVLRTAVLQSGAMSNVVVAVEVEFVEREEHMTIGEEGRGERAPKTKISKWAG